MSKTPKTFYLAGPMTGIPQFNFPLFNTAAHALRNQGYRIISPAEIDSAAVREAALQSPDGAYGSDGRVASESWGDMLARDVKMLADGVPLEESDAALCARMKAATKTWEGEGPMPPLIRIPDATRVVIDGIALLPGWESSRGARLEAFVGLLTGKEYFTVEAQRHGPTQDVDYFLSSVTSEWIKAMLAKDWADAILMHTPTYP